MKKSILAVAVSMVGFAHAGDFAQIEFAPNVRESGQQSSAVGAVTLGTKQGNLMFEGILGVDRLRGDPKTVGANVQARATYNYGLFYGRGSLGHQYVNGDNYAFYTVGAGVGYPVWNGVAVVASWDRTEAFRKDVRADFNTYKIGAEYALTKQDVVGIKWATNRGDVQSKGLGFEFTRWF